MLESAQFFHLALGFADFMREYENTGEKITNPIRNLQNCCNSPALLVEQLAAFTIAVAVLKPLLKVASCGVFQDMALAQRKVVQHLREEVQDEVKVLQLIQDSVVTPCSNALGPFGPMERFAGGVAERPQPNLAQAATDCGVRGSGARTPSRATDGDGGDVDGSEDEEYSDSDSDCEAGGATDVREATLDRANGDEGVDAYEQPTLLDGDTVRVAAQPPYDDIEDATVAEREQAAQEALKALEREPLLAARYDCPIAPSRHGVLWNECAFDLNGAPPARARVLQQAIEALCDAARLVISARSTAAEQSQEGGPANHEGAAQDVGSPPPAPTAARTTPRGARHGTGIEPAQHPTPKSRHSQGMRSGSRNAAMASCSCCGCRVL